MPKRPEIPVKDFAETVGLSLPPSFRSIPHLFGAAANNGQMLVEVQPKSAAAEGVRRLAEIVTGRAVQAS